MILKGRPISPGRAEGRVVKVGEAFSFLGGVNGSTGDLVGREGNIAGKAFAFPKGKGSTVGSFVVYDLMVHGKAPAALINREAETIVTTGAVISSVPMVDSVDIGLLEDGDDVVVDGDSGTVEIRGLPLVRVASSAVVSGGRVLLLKRPMGAKSFPGAWSLAAGKIEPGEEPEAAARREVFEETGIRVGEPFASLPPILVRGGGTMWEVHPFAYLAEGAAPSLNHENTEFAWALPGDVGARGEILVPKTRDVVLEMTGAAGR
ncbi:MAG: DUF126 domain-containing protein [Candidatus Methanoplasma sp.]|jgi:predicted aconitase with swiveling domain/predicted NUDIX family NTP pyrophosphohydrolase|nr:DUF126 domain-containing protein [Candidatus Methanoplasma sp.]